MDSDSEDIQNFDDSMPRGPESKLDNIRIDFELLIRKIINKKEFQFQAILFEDTELTNRTNLKIKALIQELKVQVDILESRLEELDIRDK